MDARFVGIDLSKDKLDVHIRPGGEKFVVSRDAGGLDELIKRLKLVHAIAIGVEATGGFEQVVTATLGGAGLPVVVVNPAQVRAFARALGQRAKTDPIDASVIAHFIEATRPQVRPLPDEQTRLLAELVTRRRQIIHMLVAERLRQQHLLSRTPHLGRSQPSDRVRQREMGHPFGEQSRERNVTKSLTQNTVALRCTSVLRLSRRAAVSASGLVREERPAAKLEQAS